MKIHPKKCEFVVTSVVYLGHRILPNGIMAHWAKVVAILEMPNPTNVHTLSDALPSHGGETHLRVSQSQVAKS
jgi:hypothetical protein